MRVEPGRSKKLIVAFHFQFSNRAAWECDACRRNGLETKRRCGWKPEALRTAPHVVWTRREAASDTCPKSYVSAQSLAWIEHFYIWKLAGGNLLDLPARQVDAFLILEQEWRAETNNVQERANR
ncbi:MAG: hypothetical protein ABI165_01780 [Bryobacteraceae bacterium]